MWGSSSNKPCYFPKNWDFSPFFASLELWRSENSGYDPLDLNSYFTLNSKYTTHYINIQIRGESLIPSFSSAFSGATTWLKVSTISWRPCFFWLFESIELKNRNFFLTFEYKNTLKGPVWTLLKFSYSEYNLSQWCHLLSQLYRFPSSYLFSAKQH